MTDDPEIIHSQPTGTVKPVISTETHPYTYVEIRVQTGDRDGVEFRREFDPAEAFPGEVFEDLARTVRRYLSGADERGEP